VSHSLQHENPIPLDRDAIESTDQSRSTPSRHASPVNQMVDVQSVLDGRIEARELAERHDRLWLAVAVDVANPESPRANQRLAIDQLRPSSAGHVNEAPDAARIGNQAESAVWNRSALDFVLIGNSGCTCIRAQAGGQ
jgi:hypothetical protein